MPVIEYIFSINKQKTRMKSITLILFLALSPLFCFAQIQNNRTRISDDIEVTRLSDNAYSYTATAEIEGFGLVPSNGVILVNKGKAFLLDTPVNNEQTETLVTWITNTLQTQLIGFIPNHWHADCLGGLGYLQKQGIKSYASQLTIDLAKENGKPLPDQGFRDSLALKLSDMDIQCYYLGGGHSKDNIVVWIPSEKILFGGCLIKDRSAQNLGNLEDAVPEEWGTTLDKVLAKFPSAQIVIPGHGQTGDLELVRHTKDLLSK